MLFRLSKQQTNQLLHILQFYWEEMRNEAQTPQDKDAVRFANRLEEKIWKLMRSRK